MTLENYVILGSVNKNYLRIFEIWYSFFSKYELNEKLTLLSFDQQSTARLTELGIHIIEIPREVRRQEIVEIRLGIIADYLSKGIHVLHTDIDAFWVNNPLLLFGREGADLEISIGHGRPSWVLKDWGFTLCCGFFLIRANESTRSLVSKWSKEVSKYQSDQTALNDIIRRTGITWATNSIYSNEGHCEQLNVSINALNYDVISRGKDGLSVIDPAKLLVFHPFFNHVMQQSKVIAAIGMLEQIGHPVGQPLKEKLLYTITYWINDFGYFVKYHVQSVFTKGTRKIKTFIGR